MSTDTELNNLKKQQGEKAAIEVGLMLEKVELPLLESKEFSTP